jgi:ectoine hydroxylase-related dioxygenase (phytanoyl-CoA dioxygenase family)
VAEITPRTISDGEAAFFRQHGWVKLDALISSEAAAELLRQAKARVSNRSVESRQSAGLKGGDRPFVNTRESASVDIATGEPVDQFFYKFSHSPEMGQVGAKLCGEPVRFLVDQVLVKPPSSDVPGAGETAWHVDFSGQPNSPFTDPNFEFLIFLALNDIPPERSTMRFIGPQDISAEVWKIASQSPLTESYAKLDQLNILSPPIHLRPGDATVHSGTTMQSTPKNTTDEPRWIYNTVQFPARCKWTGEHFWPVEGAELVVGGTFPDHRFPVL